MRTAYLAARLKRVLVGWQRAATAVSLVLAGLAFAGWAIRVPFLAGVLGNWPPMRPWTAVLLVLLGAAILAQSGHPSTVRVWVGRSLAAVTGILAAFFLIEQAAGCSSALDDALFPGLLRELSGVDSGRLPMLAATPVLLLSLAVVLTRVDRRWVPTVWAVSLAVAAMFAAIAVGQYLFGSLSHLEFAPAPGNAISAALAMALLTVAEFLARPDRKPVAWLLSRPDRIYLVQLAGIVFVLPIMACALHSIMSIRGMEEERAWVVALLVSVTVGGAAIFYVSDHERRTWLATDAQFRSIVTNAPNAIAVHNMKHGYEFANRAFCGFVGCLDPRELVGLSPEDLASPNPELARRFRDGESAAARGQTSQFEQEFTVGDHHRTIEVQMFPVDDGHGAITSIATIGTDVTERKRVESELRERLAFEEGIALAINEDRLLVFAQPIVDAHTGQLVEEELLVRMAGPDGEVIGPDLFLPQAMGFGMMPTIDRFMVTRAIEAARAGRQVAVNLSGASINDPATVDAIVALLRQAGDAAGLVSFEITESAALASAAIAEQFSDAMRGLGCRLALDDFGTGFGAFTELRGMTLHSLKIDQSFVRNMLADTRDESVVKMIVGIAREFGLVTTAEGVEDDATRTRLVELGVDRLQGYLIGKPEPVESSAAETRGPGLLEAAKGSP